MKKPNKTFSAFICLDLEHPLVAWECYRGTLISAYVDASNNFINTSMRIANLIGGSNINLANELFFEHIREHHFPDSVSRMRCLYAFENKDFAEKSCKEWGTEFFPIENLVEVGVGANYVTKVDSNLLMLTKMKMV